MSDLFNVVLHLKGCVKGDEAVLALGEVVEVQVVLLLRVNVTLKVEHGLDVVVQHLGAHPALKRTDGVRRAANLVPKFGGPWPMLFPIMD